MPRRHLLGLLSASLLLLGPALLASPPATGANPPPSSTAITPGHTTAHKIGTTRLVKATGESGAGELRPDADEAGTARRAVANRSTKSRARSTRANPTPSGIAPTQSLTVASAGAGFRALNHVDQRLADNGNQFSLVPPDQALCTNGSDVFEGVNTAFRVYDSAGQPRTETVSANQFFWKDHELDRATGVASPHQMGDPSCVYDAGSQRFFLTVYDLVSDADGNPTGPSFTDIAVSPPGTAVGTWTIYQLDGTDDGSNGTPSHPGCPCFGDYPHLGTDANGLYITTNEYSTLGEEYNGAQVYALDKQALVAGTADIPAAHFDTARSDLYQGVLYDGFTLAPALAADANYAPGTMYFLSSDAFSGDVPITSRQILVWKIANTAALHTNPAALRLTHTTSAVDAYAVPPPSDQKAGPVPLADCLNVTACAKVLLGTPNRFKESEFAFDSSDTRMLQAAYAHGRLWGALDTAVDVGGTTKAGVAYYVVDPASSTTVKQGTLAVPGNNISYPSLGVTSAGRAAMALTLTGKDYYPSAAYVRLDDLAGTPASPVRVLGAGAGPYDSFDGYRAFEYNRPRWGDYGAASVVGGNVWLASEYIAQSCTLTQYRAEPFGSCGGTRTALANWATHIARVAP